MNMQSSTSKSSIRLEIGSGCSPQPGYLACDIRELPEVDVVCPADDLPFYSGSVDAIFSRHVIEHFTLKGFLKTLQEWNRVLKPGGELYLICPNLLWHCQQLLTGSHASLYTKSSGSNDRYWALGSLFGWQQDQHDVHRFGYYFELLRDILNEMGFAHITDLTDTPESKEQAPWHLEVRARKSSDRVCYQATRMFRHFNVRH